MGLKSDKTDALIRKFEDHGVRFVFPNQNNNGGRATHRQKPLRRPKPLSRSKCSTPPSSKPTSKHS